MQVDGESPLFVISVAAELAGMHPQTLRQYDRMGLVSPKRTAGKSRRYSMRDVAQLREIQQLSSEGVSLEGIRAMAKDARTFTPADVPSPQEIGEPGRFPFTRGLHASGYGGRLWTMRQYAGFASASESNRRYRYLLEQGTTGLSVAFDLPTQIGYDADDPHAQGEVGRVGVSIGSLEDM